MNNYKQYNHVHDISLLLPFSVVGERAGTIGFEEITVGNCHAVLLHGTTRVNILVPAGTASFMVMQKREFTRGSDMPAVKVFPGRTVACIEAQKLSWTSGSGNTT